MGDLIFIIKMTVYTLFIVILLQIKVGPTTLEQKVIEWTHHSQLAGAIQGVALGATTFIGDQFKALRGKINSKYIEKHSSGQIPGERLKSKIKDIKRSLKADWEVKKVQAEELIQEQLEDNQE